MFIRESDTDTAALWYTVGDLFLYGVRHTIRPYDTEPD